MLFKMKFGACMLALTTAYYACAQETGKAGSAQNPASGSQVGKTPSSTETPTGEKENPNRRRDNASNDAQNRSSDAQNPAKTGENRTGENRTGEDRNQNRRDATTTTQRTENRERRTGAANDSPLDSQLASCLLIGNQKEVAISQFASERAKNEKVKEFAKQMIKDHTQAITLLQRFAGPDASKDLSSSTESTRSNRLETSTTVDANRSPEGERRDSANPANRDRGANRKSGEAKNAAGNDSTRSAEATARTSSDSAAPPRSTVNPADQNENRSDRNSSVTTAQVRSEHEAIPDKMAAIQREVAQKCIAMAKHELEQSSNFDQAYVGMQISAHVGMIAHLETYKSYASQDLGKVIQESLDTAQGHLRHAKELVMEISHDKTGSNRSGAASSSETNNRNEASGRDNNARNPANRDDSSSREGVIKKDAPKN